MDGSRTPATVSVEGFAVTWSPEAVYYLPMAELGAAPGCCALLSGVLQDPTAEKARLQDALFRVCKCTRVWLNLRNVVHSACDRIMCSVQNVRGMLPVDPVLLSKL